MASKKRDGSLTKAARLIVLLRWQDAGLLDGKSAERVSQMFPESCRPSGLTIWRDIQDLPGLREILKGMDSSKQE